MEDSSLLPKSSDADVVSVSNYEIPWSSDKDYQLGKIGIRITVEVCPAQPEVKELPPISKREIRRYSMSQNQIVKSQNILKRADENGVGEIARNLWSFNEYFSLYISERFNHWQFKLPPYGAKNSKYKYAALIVFPGEQVSVVFKADNFQRIYNKSDSECCEFINCLHSGLGKPELSRSRIMEGGWISLLLSSPEQANLFIKEFCFFTGTP